MSKLDSNPALSRDRKIRYIFVYILYSIKLYPNGVNEHTIYRRAYFYDTTFSVIIKVFVVKEPNKSQFH